MAMNLKEAVEKFGSIASGWERALDRCLKTVWRICNYNLVDNIFAPRRRIFIALDKDSISLAYGSRFLGKSKIHACRKYTYDLKFQDNISRKYSYQDGYLPKPEMVASSLTYLVEEFKAQNSQVILAIPKAWIIYRTVDFPSAVSENIHEVITYELDRLMSLNADNAYFDYKIVDKTRDNLKVSITAARKDLIDSYIKEIEETGVAVEKVTASLSVIGGILNHFYGRQCFALLEIYNDEYEISGIREGTVLFAHKEKYDSGSKEEKDKLLSAELTSHCENLKQNGQCVQAVVCCDDERFRKIQEGVGVPVHHIKKSHVCLDYKGEIQETDLLSASGCLELHVGSIECVNLISQKNKTLSNQSFQFSAFLAIAAIIIGMISLFAPLVFEKVRIYEIEKQTDLLSEDFRKTEPQKNELDTILYQIRTTNEFKNSKPPRILLLRELSDILPAQYWISAMTITENTITIEMQGKGTQGDVVSLLEASPYFENVRRVNQREAREENTMKAGANSFMLDIVNQVAERGNRK